MTLTLPSKFNSYIKQDTKKKDIEKKDTEKKDIEKKDIEKKDIEKKDTKNSIKHFPKINNNNNNNNNKPDTELATSADIKAHIIDKQKLLKQRYKSFLETKKTIKNNTELIYTALKKLPKESQSKLTESVRLNTILNDSINAVWREIYKRDKKVYKRLI